MSRSVRAQRLLLVVVAAAALAGCGERKKDRAATTLAARVDGAEVSLAQVNAVLQQQRNLRPEQSDAASRQILERLIDQTLVLKQAAEMGLERDPRIAQQLETARREVLVRAWAERLTDEVPKPAAEEIRRAYDERPALFRDRRVFQLQEVLIDVAPEQASALRQQLAAAPNLATFLETLKASEVRVASSQAVRAAEQLPAAMLEHLLRLQDGQAVVNQGPQGLQVTVLLGSRPQPVSEEAARPAIERLLLAERKRRLLDQKVKALRGAARIEYLGSYAHGPRPAASAAIDLGPEPAGK